MTTLKKAAAIIIAAVISGCSSSPKVDSRPVIAGAPGWVNSGTILLHAKDNRLFHGIGQASAMDTISLQKSAADDKAKAEVARILSAYLEQISRNFIAQVKPGEASITQELLMRQISNITEHNRSRTKIRGSWRDPRTGIVYSIAELNLRQVKNSLAASDINEEFRRYIEIHADSIFDQAARKK